MSGCNCLCCKARRLQQGESATTDNSPECEGCRDNDGGSSFGVGTWPHRPSCTRAAERVCPKCKAQLFNVTKCTCELVEESPTARKPAKPPVSDEWYRKMAEAEEGYDTVAGSAEIAAKSLETARTADDEQPSMEAWLEGFTCANDGFDREDLEDAFKAGWRAKVARPATQEPPHQRALERNALIEAAGWLETNLEEWVKEGYVDCRGDEDCDHCYGVQIASRIRAVLDRAQHVEKEGGK